MSKRDNARKAAFFCVILILVLVMMISGLRILESTVFYREQPQEETYERKTITHNGVEYYPRQDITTILVMGIDQMGPVQDSGSYKNHGTADMVMLVICDEKSEECRILALNRDTMLEMPVLGLGGREAGTEYGQLALSHTFGSGLEDSCENVKKTVSNFLNRINIDYYMSMNMEAISILNDSVGGVTVTVVDDFSEVTPSIARGEVKLMGEQAMSFVRTRKEVGNQLNISRMERQKEYVRNFMDALRVKMEQDGTYALTAYDAVAPYIVTDISANAFSGMLQRYADFALAEVITPEGENVLGESYYEFHVDEEKLDELILELFYIPKA